MENTSPFTFIASRITHLDFDSNIFIFDENKFDKKFGCSAEVHDLRNSDGKRYGEVVLKVQVELDNKQPDPDSKKGSIHLTIEGGFSAPEDMAEEEFSTMLKVNGSAALYSIARAYLISVTSQSFVRGQITLPLVNFFPQKKPKDDVK